jgi:hypothetical protein
VRDPFDFLVALLGVVVPVVLTLYLRRRDRIAGLEKRIDKAFRVLAVITGDPNIEGSTSD